MPTRQGPRGQPAVFLTSSEEMVALARRAPYRCRGVLPQISILAGLLPRPHAAGSGVRRDGRSDQNAFARLRLAVVSCSDEARVAG
jgi:hypothetical protein